MGIHFPCQKRKPVDMTRVTFEHFLQLRSFELLGRGMGRLEETLACIIRPPLPFNNLPALSTTLPPGSPAAQCCQAARFDPKNSNIGLEPCSATPALHLWAWPKPYVWRMEVVLLAIDLKRSCYVPGFCHVP